MNVRVSGKLESQGIEACKQGAVLGAVIVERDLRLILGPDKSSVQLGAYLEPKRVGMIP